MEARVEKPGTYRVWEQFLAVTTERRIFSRGRPEITSF